MINAKSEIKILRILDKLFKDRNNTKLPEPENYSVIDNVNICMITAKTEEAKKILLRFIDIENQKKDVNIEYTNEISVSKFSTEYLNKILKIFEYNDTVKITMGKDKPITIENEDFKVILAPKSGDD
jgi:exosome complex RNA-binding protein Csl4